jgi:hypothetical protein
VMLSTHGIHRGISHLLASSQHSNKLH